MKITMFCRTRWLPWAVLFAACSKNPAPFPVGSLPENRGPARVALSAAPRTLVAEGGEADDRSKERLADRLNQATGHNVIVIRRTGATDLSMLEVQAAEQNAHAILTLSHATGTPNSFIFVTVRSVETGELVADTAVPRGATDRIIEEIRDWYVSSAPKLDKLPSLSHLNLLKRFEKEGHCQSALALLSRVEFLRQEEMQESERIAGRCRRQIDRVEATAGVPLRVRTENVSPPFQAVMADRARESKLLRELQTFYHQTADLSLACAENCSRGKIRLSLTYDPDWYKEQKPDRNHPLRPYERLARALLEYRTSLRKTIPIGEFPLELFLTNSNTNLAIVVHGTAEQPRLQPKTDALEFFKLEP